VAVGRKAGRQVAKDYLLWPLLAGPFFLPVPVLRHRPDDVEVVGVRAEERHADPGDEGARSGIPGVELVGQGGVAGVEGDIGSVAAGMGGEVEVVLDGDEQRVVGERLSDRAGGDAQRPAKAELIVKQASAATAAAVTPMRFADARVQLAGEAGWT
jgi:hypothetical protein